MKNDFCACRVRAASHFIESVADLCYHSITSTVCVLSHIGTVITVITLLCCESVTGVCLCR